MLLRIVASIAFLLIANTANGASFALHDCPIEGSKETGRCGTFMVPEDRAKQQGRQLGLPVIVLPSRTKLAKEPIFYLSGGPGQAATEGASDMSDWMRQDHDIVFLDLRGTGGESKLDCPGDGSDENIQGYLEPPFHDASRYAQCAAALSKKADLSQYSTPVSMQDLDDLRAALGYGKIDLYGGSYGTRAALVYLHMFGRNAHAAFLTANAPMANRAPLYHAAAAERAFETVVAQCAADPACHKAFPDPKADLDAVLAALNARPARVTAKHPVTGKPTEVTLTRSAFGDGLRVMLYSEETDRRLPLLLHEARKGDYAPFANGALQLGRNLQQGLHLGLLLSVSCTEDVARIRPDEVEKATKGSFIGDERVRGQMAACAVWPRTKLPADYAAPFTSDVAALIVSGNLDPVTPPMWGKEMRKSLPNSLHVVMPGAHAAASPCVDAMTKTLFETGSVKAIDTSCIAQAKLRPFVLQ
jgi:pimeloyl-ACP methyl ester carboxylesterase